jgi:pentatricopeptide repeat protein
MFSQKAPRLAALARASCAPRQTLLKRPFLLPLATTTRHFHPSFYNHNATFPTTKDAEAIIPVLDAISTKTTASYNQLLGQLASEGRSIQAQKLYDAIFRNHSLVADLETYSQLMLAYINDGQFEDAMEIYYEIRDHEGSSLSNLRLTAETYATMISSLTNAKNVDLSAQRNFDTTSEPMYEYSVQDGDTAIFHNLDGDSQPSLLVALTLFNDMRHLEIRPTSSMYIDMLKACADQQDDFVLEKLHKLIRMDLYFDPDIQVYNGLMKAYRAVGDGAAVLEIWDIAESSHAFDGTSVSTVLKTCLDHGYYTRSNAIWNVLNAFQPQIKLSVQDFNHYLEGVLINGKDIDRAQQVLEEGLSRGNADETSVNILENYHNNK